MEWEIFPALIRGGSLVVASDDGRLAGTEPWAGRSKLGTQGLDPKHKDIARSMTAKGPPPAISRHLAPRVEVYSAP